MKDLDELALQYSRTLISNIPGISVLSDWRFESTHTAILSIGISLKEDSLVEDIPNYTNWDLVVDFAEDQMGRVQMHPSLNENGIASTFQHQQYNGRKHKLWSVRNGHICCLLNTHGLSMSRNALKIEPSYTIDRILWHSNRAIEWLESASKGKLVNDGDYFELPDFNTQEKSDPRHLAYYENTESFNLWSESTTQFGVATYSIDKYSIIVKKYSDAKGYETIYEPNWGSYVQQLNNNRNAIWIKLNDVPVVKNWEVPHSLRELNDLLTKQGINLDECIKATIKNVNYCYEVLLFIGFPTPKKIGESNNKFHWQTIILGPSIKKNSRSSRSQLIINHIKTESKINWIPQSQNWHPEYLQNRGRVKKQLSDSKVLIGCGALGSNVAEQLVRMGVNNLILIDDQFFEAGNLVRHTLDIGSINMYKSVMLAEKLNRINPSAKIYSFTKSMPTDDKDILEKLIDIDLVLDFSASDKLISDFSSLKLSDDSLFVSCSMGLNASKLFFYAQTSKYFSNENFNNWFQPYRNQEHELVEKEDLPRGATCWHPLVPAPLNRIAAFSGIIIELIENIILNRNDKAVAICHEWEIPKIKYFE